MRPEGAVCAPTARSVRLAALFLASAALLGCDTLPLRRGANTAPLNGDALTADRDTTAALLLGATVQTLQRLAVGSPTEQADIAASARSAFERAPMGGAQLRYALTLGTLGYGARDPERARELLRELAAQPEQLTPLERAMNLWQLAQLERELGLKSDNERLQADAQRGDAARQVVANRRLQTALEENARLRAQLREAQAKLDAIATIERNASGR